jgi:5'-deoxynucleotidase YfbR-like HD superfamily hydrolase
MLLNDLAARIEFLRAGGAVRRYHSSRVEPQTVAAHSAGVVDIIVELCPDARPQLLVAALRHDVYEYITGDIPYSAKKANPLLREQAHKMERELNDEWGFIPMIYPHEKALLKFADMAECYLYTREQTRTGNTYALEIYSNARRALDALAKADALTDTLKLRIDQFMNEVIR